VAAEKWFGALVQAAERAAALRRGGYGSAVPIRTEHFQGRVVGSGGARQVWPRGRELATYCSSGY